MSRVIFDIETDGLLGSVSKLWCIVCRDADTGAVTTFGPDEGQKGVDFLLSCDELIGHNIIGYDIPALAELGFINGHPLPKLTDTLVMSRVIHANLGELDRVKNLKSEYIPSKLVGSHSLKA